MSIYTTQTWASSTQYFKNDVVWGGTALPYFYYALKNHVSGGDFAADIADGDWDGVLTIQSVVYPHFIWIPSFGLNVKLTPRVKTVKFGDGYEQRTPDGINNDLLEIDYIFESRNLAEATAILHFLRSRYGTETFLHTPIAPYDKQKKFKCSSWDHTQVFIDNFSIRAKFEEVSV